MHEESPRRFLLIDESQASFQVWECIARVLTGLPPLEFIYAEDSDEAFTILETQAIDAILVNLDDEYSAEREAFLEGLVGTHPPVFVQTSGKTGMRETDIFFTNKADSLEAIQKTLLMATAAADQNKQPKKSNYMH
ncbi:hypothetical protein JNK13_08520 [bacterium]|nr:hypothetical protein [bacterium]